MAKKNGTGRSDCIIYEQIENKSKEIIIREGFENITLNQLQKELNIDPIVFYERYDNLEKLLDLLIRKYDYWIADIFHQKYKEDDIFNSICEVFDEIINMLNSDRFILEIALWNIHSRHYLAKRAGASWSINSMAYIDKINKIINKSCGFDFSSVFNMLLSGLFYLFLEDASKIADSKDNNIQIENLKKQIKDTLLSLIPSPNE
ncbi:AcrR family transcriptional regulator [Dysgonomonas sp. PFB1-18]|uniref:TetR/AcrR family transcriptional regulator n=1 Tax=unclassified Dysgonomonas TaxID=2630389 RepID=UPI002474D724|nr:MULTISPECIES: hypothetical protein [unclassified Dysgonomonas]MDH6310937.1 AcrR family transcriptional regulator [Dysgonomonas sp. PF1-14]MDH6340848.1 AcrR family transcriptional regulator [Dysgonomonas sp. PF1-16]MDH6382460.1 AcrR family transcriptional regulator [Dysgonomonas sp. PFB1-18]MDH6399809.1 AcrR family transcriptional regulator [Dysgonomonas sp. PF1-23]